MGMLLSLQEREKLLVYTAAKLALESKDKGMKLNLPEATAVVTSFCWRAPARGARSPTSWRRDGTYSRAKRSWRGAGDARTGAGRGHVRGRHQDDHRLGADTMSENEGDRGKQPGRRAEEGELGAVRQRHTGERQPSEWRRPGTARMQPPWHRYAGDRPQDEPMVPGEVLYGEEPVKINAGKDVPTLRVRNTSDRQVQVGSHYHFFEVNPALDFDRDAAYGRRLNLLSSGAVRFEPGAEEEVELIPIAGHRIVAGLRGEAGGELDG
jgi:urease subunit beta